MCSADVAIFWVSVNTMRRYSKASTLSNRTPPKHQICHKQVTCIPIFNYQSPSVCAKHIIEVLSQSFWGSSSLHTAYALLAQCVTHTMDGHPYPSKPLLPLRHCSQHLFLERTVRRIACSPASHPICTPHVPANQIDVVPPRLIVSNLKKIWW